MESILSEHDGDGNNAPMDFDTLFDTKALRIMRILIPFLPVPYQPLLAVWVRFSQLQYALSLLKSGRFHTGITDISEGFRSSASTEQTITHLLHALKPCLSKTEYQELVRMQNLFSTYQRFQQIMPYLSALGGMSGDLSASDMMNMFSAMQGGGENTSASDIMSAFSAMQGVGKAPNPMPEKNTDSADQHESVPTEDGNLKAAEKSMQDSGSGMNMSQILDLISLFQTSSNETDAENNTPERQDDPNHE